ncbi:MAG TPA: hypothetical protein PLP29_00420 [Candidatus Ozemobacteraceae bacterium]|nr:hypothetical protein [Candidatus Ozemobacteraceae bacterium]
MRDALLEQALAAFIAEPGRPALDALLAASGPFVVDQARFWRSSRLSFIDRCRELLTEMFLILIDDVRTDRAAHPASILSYLSLRLRRLTRPDLPKDLPGGLPDELPDAGRCSFTPMRLDLVRELTRCTRTSLLQEENATIRELEFLFIHISPHLAGISRFLAASAGQNPETRAEADKKRHQSFTRGLRSRYDNLRSGDWRDVATWSHGERSHLAWSLISFTRVERNRLGDQLAGGLDAWRDDPDPYRTEMSRAALVGPALDSLAPLYRAVPGAARRVVPKAAEAAAPYGVPREEENPLDLLLHPGLESRRRASVPHIVRQAAASYGAAPAGEGPTGMERDDAADAYRQAADAVRIWFLSIADGVAMRPGSKRPERRGGECS